MTRVVRFVAAFLLTLGFVVGFGCESKNEGQPNPDLKVPDVPPGGHGVAKGALKQGEKTPGK